MMVNHPEHAPITQFPIHDNCLVIGGISLARLAQRIGSTPFYAYDRQLISARVQSLRQHLPANIHLHYAMKANPMPAVVQHLAGLVDGIDVASTGEMKVALDAGVAPEAISFAGPGKSRQELACAIAAGIILNVESEYELETIAQLAKETGFQASVAVRVNPDFELKSSGMKMGGGSKQFGIDAERVPAVLQRIAQLKLDFEGLHIFSGSQNLRVEAIQEAHEKTLQLGLQLAAVSPVPVRTINIGGGFGVPYFPGENPLDLGAVGNNLQHLLAAIPVRFSTIRFIIELGRYIVAEAGIYVCRVLERKISRGQVFLITNGGLHHHLAASGNFGQVIRKNYPVAIGNKMGINDTETVSVVGPLCTPLDLLADRMALSRAEPGDWVVVFQSGAYGLTASPVAFLSHPAPLEVLV
ncbi:pyridoxal-dependent decarboxylase, exosortase A system-associated [Nitrosomonas sp.]|uniref:pyridoxal-dependent decarboxylase, exosortase A system-associated n=1 Tax=Nitrosomonas sp. TaxID=42353 RepID=UPI0025DDE35C|nr:pyridoxal-dependent decarboxylase, exosortase A system-associated [Nitrosomonas sp.]MCC6915769.1 pyridoxal-dependent decarboxylase, exosortase A system-associated [Nitrosomonas sp.]